jgi:hypothetical protein
MSVGLPPLVEFRMDRMTAIRRSLAAFVWSFFGLLPVIGVIPGICALAHWSAVRSKYRDGWNPAAAYLKAGALLAVLGLLNTLLWGVVVAMVIASSG